MPRIVLAESYLFSKKNNLIECMLDKNGLIFVFSLDCNFFGFLKKEQSLSWTLQGLFNQVAYPSLESWRLFIKALNLFTDIFKRNLWNGLFNTWNKNIILCLKLDKVSKTMLMQILPADLLLTKQKILPLAFHILVFTSPLPAVLFVKIPLLVSIVHYKVFKYSRGTSELANASRFCLCTKHIAIPYHHFCDHIANNKISIQHIIWKDSRIIVSRIPTTVY